MNLLDGGSRMLMLPGELKLKPQVRQTFTPESLVRTYVQKGRKDLERLTIYDKQSDTLRVREEFSFENLSAQQSREIFDAQRYVERMSTRLQNPPATYGDLVRFDVETFASCVRPAREYSCWGAKEVGGANSQTVITFFRSQFPGARIVLQVRDPRFIVRSIILDRRRNNINLKPTAVWRECWEAQEIINFVYENIGREIVLTYEHLTRDTEGETRRLAAALELPFEPIYCEPSTLGVPVVVRTASQKTTKVFQQEQNWRKDLKPSQIAAMNLFARLAPANFARAGKPFIAYPDLISKLDQVRTSVGSTATD